MTYTVAGPGPILLVDDDPVDIAILRRCFGKSTLASTHTLVALTSGTEALAYMDGVEAGTQEMPSIVLLDINMPHLDGFTTLERMRSRPAFAEVPAVVFVTNSDNPRDLSRATDLGAGFIEKFSDWRAGVAFFERLKG